MEETVHSLLQYKTRAETLKQEKSSLAATLEAKNSHYQAQLSHLQAENESLRGQLLTLSSGLDNECCIDDVAHQVISTILSQKGLREELGCMRSRVRELEAQNSALSALLVRQLRPHPRPSPASPPSPASVEKQAGVINFDTKSCRSSPGSLPPHNCRLEHRAVSSTSLISFKEDSPPPQLQPCLSQLSTNDKRRHRILASLWAELRGLEVTPAALARALNAVDAAHLIPPARPHSLHLPAPATAPAIIEGNNEEEQAAGSPESGNKDEGYSTMSSDVQADSSRQSEHNRELEDLKEASDETDNQTIVSVGLRDHRVAVSETLTPERGSLARYSFPPAKFSLPFKRAARSLSDSHLCVSFAPCFETRFSIFSSAPSSGGVVVLELAGAGNGVGSLAGVDGSQYDAEYVRHWLEIDDARSALQQRHRDLLDLDYDRAEVEDWSLSLSCDDLREDWRRKDPATPGQLSLSTLPSIKEDDILEHDDAAAECVWPEGNWTCDASPAHSISVSPSPPASWSSGAGSDLPEDGRQSAPPGEEMTNSGIGIDFTRDFYRLVKYESTRSLASDASQPPPDRDKALKSVLDFIAEQKKYCRDREESDSRPTSEIIEMHYENRYFDTNEFKKSESLPARGESPIDFSLLETEADERYFKRVQEKNEFNRNSNPFIFETDSDGSSLIERRIDHQELIVREPLPSPCINYFSPELEVSSSSKLGNGFLPSTKLANEIITPVRKTIDSPIPLRRTTHSLDRTPISKRNGIALDNSIVEEVFNGCKRNSTLQPLPEEEENSRSSEEKQSPNSTNSSPLKGNSCNGSPTHLDSKKNSKRSKIPMATGLKKCQRKVTSKIPVSKTHSSKNGEGESSLQFLECASSKDVIEELNRMISQSEETNPSNSDETIKIYHEDKDLWCPSGWVRVQKQNDYDDPTKRASLLDVMVASSDSSPSPTEAEEEGGAQYSKLHHLHRNRRQKKAAALRERGMAVLRESCCRRPSILDREDLFVRYGEREREAVASFDFLENLTSSASSPDNDTQLCKEQFNKSEVEVLENPGLCDPT